jgi:hypothetical protein
MLGSFRGNVWETPAISRKRFSWTSALTNHSAPALQSVFSGQAGGWPKRFGEMVKGENMGFAFAPSRWRSPRTFRLEGRDSAQNILAQPKR